MSEENINKPENIPEQPTEPKPPKKPIRLSLTVFVCSLVAAILAAVMLTSALLSSAYQKKLAEAKSDGAQNGAQIEKGSLEYDLEVLRAIFEQFSFAELDEEQLRTVVLKAYVYATGDKYAEYYTDEEYAALTADLGGKTQGIGINIINAETEIGGVTYKGLKIINVIKSSPAEKNELKVGDFIIAVGNSDENQTVSSLGYDTALKNLQGVAGTTAEFLAYRPSTGEILEFSILREEFTSESVMYKKADADVGENVGIIKIIEFDATTQSQVAGAIDALKGEGCDKFVFDVRYNPGGTLNSIVDTMSLFLNEGDTVLSYKDKAGTETVGKVRASALTGKYRGLNMVVLCNGNTASAAELFVANFRDHGLGEIIGEKTYGKGSMQSYIPLSNYGCNGYLKITAHMYFPPSGVGYDGTGIEPTKTVAQSDEALSMNIYDIMGTSKDSQLVAAVEYLKN